MAERKVKMSFGYEEWEFNTPEELAMTAEKEFKTSGIRGDSLVIVIRNKNINRYACSFADAALIEQGRIIEVSINNSHQHSVRWRGKVKGTE